MNQPTSTTGRLYDRYFALAIIAQSFFVIANTLMAHYSRWIEFLGGDLTQVGWIMGIGSAAGLVLRPWMAQWINRMGALHTWGVGFLVFAAGSLGNLLLQDIGIGIYLFRSGLVLGAAIVFASSLTYVAQIAPENRRTEAIGILGVGGFLGMLVGPFMGDLFLSAEQRQRDDFWWLFVVAALVNLVPLLLIVFLPRASKTAGGGLGLQEFLSVIRRHWPGSILLVDMAFGVCMTAPFVFVASFIDDASIRLPGYSTLGVFFWLYAGIAIVVRVGFRGLPEKFGSRKVLVAGGILMSVGMLTFVPVSESMPWLILIPAGLCGTGHGLMFHTMTSLTLHSFPMDVRGTGSALALMMLDAGSIVGAPILGWIGEAWGYEFLFISIAAFCSFAICIYGYNERANF